MNNKKIWAEVSIVGCAVIMLLFTLAISVQNNPQIKENKYNEKKSSSYSPYRTQTAPTIALTGEERADICNLAIAQKGVQEDGSPGDGYTPYHKWAATTAKNNGYGAQYKHNGIIILIFIIIGVYYL